MRPMMLQRQLADAAPLFRNVLMYGRAADLEALLAQTAPVVAGRGATLRLLETPGGRTPAALDRLVRTIEDRGAAVVREHAAAVHPPPLAALAARDGHDLVAGSLANAKTGARPPAWLRALVNRCPCAVWLGRADQRHAPRRLLAAINPAAAEDDGLSVDVLTVAGAVAEHAGSELHVCHAWVPFGAHLLRSRYEPAEYAEYVEHARIEARRGVDRLLTAARTATAIAPAGVHLVRGEVDEALPRLIGGGHMDLLVVGTRGRRTRVASALLRPHVERLLPRCACSMLVVKRGFLPV